MKPELEQVLQELVDICLPEQARPKYRTPHITREEKLLWGPGPWIDELDYDRWQDPVTEYTCTIIRNEHLGNLLGYVNVPAYSKLFGKGYEHELLDSINVHGGLTYADIDSYENAWRFGFDCGHYQDLTPKSNALLRAMITTNTFRDKDVYRDWNYVKTEVTELARQLKERE